MSSPLSLACRVGQASLPVTTTPALSLLLLFVPVVASSTVRCDAVRRTFSFVHLIFLLVFLVSQCALCPCLYFALPINVLSPLYPFVSFFYSCCITVSCLVLRIVSTALSNSSSHVGHSRVDTNGHSCSLHSFIQFVIHSFNLSFHFSGSFIPSSVSSFHCSLSTTHHSWAFVSFNHLLHCFFIRLLLAPLLLHYHIILITLLFKQRFFFQSYPHSHTPKHTGSGPFSSYAVSS
jgi:hypothetical protein